MTRILVTGTTGFIGRELAPALVSLNHDVYCLERYVAGRYNEYRKHFKTVFANLNDRFAVRNIVKAVQPEVVIHIGALTPVSYSYDRPIEMLETNYIATVNLAEAAMREDDNLKQFIFAGSSECYGNQTTVPIKEDAVYHPVSPYGASKVAAIQYLQYLRYGYGFPATVILPFNTYGRSYCKHFIVEKILSQMLNGDREVLLGDPTPRRDLLYVSDHVAAYLKALDNSKAIGENFNVCTGKNIQIGELAEKCAEMTNYKGDVVWGTTPARPIEIMVLVGDNGKANQLLDWSPTVSLEDGLTKTIAKLKQNG